GGRTNPGRAERDSGVQEAAAVYWVGRNSETAVAISAVRNGRPQISRQCRTTSASNCNAETSFGFLSGDFWPPSVREDSSSWAVSGMALSRLAGGLVYERSQGLTRPRRASQLHEPALTAPSCHQARV